MVLPPGGCRVRSGPGFLRTFAVVVILMGGLRYWAAGIAERQTARPHAAMTGKICAEPDLHRAWRYGLSYYGGAALPDCKSAPRRWHAGNSEFGLYLSDTASQPSLLYLCVRLWVASGTSFRSTDPFPSRFFGFGLFQPFASFAIALIALGFSLLPGRTFRASSLSTCCRLFRRVVALFPLRDHVGRHGPHSSSNQNSRSPTSVGPVSVLARFCMVSRTARYRAVRAPAGYG